MQVETAQPLSKLCLEFPDLNIGKILRFLDLFLGSFLYIYCLSSYCFIVQNEGCYRKSRKGPLIISFEGKVKEIFVVF